MRETELKAVVPDESTCIARLLAAGATPVWAGRMEDRRYDFPDRRLTMSDIVLRVRVQRGTEGTSATLDWKGAASFEAGYKHREERNAAIGDPAQMESILEALGYIVTRAIDRDVRVLRLGHADVRFEQYPRMDTLIEVEGPPEAIEEAISASGLPRGSFRTDRLFMFVQRFEARTGQRAAISDAELSGDYRFAVDDA